MSWSLDIANRLKNSVQSQREGI